MGSTYAIGDIHGDLEALEKLFAKMPRRFKKDDTIVFIGDYVDRGPRSAEVVAYVRALEKKAPCKIVVLRGNHEDAWVKVCTEGWPEFVMPRKNGCLEALRSFKGEPQPHEDDVPTNAEFKEMLTGSFFPKDVVEWMQALPYFYEDEHAIYVHAGLSRQDKNGPFPHPRDVEPKRSLLWVRDRDFFKNYRGKMMVFGHTTTEHLPVELSSYTAEDPTDLWAGPAAIGLDTGAGKGGFLSAIVLPSGFVYESRAEGWNQSVAPLSKRSMRSVRRSLLLSLGSLLVGCAAGSGAEDSAASGVGSARRGLRVEGSRRTAAAATPPFTPNELRKTLRALISLHTPRESPKPGEWLSDHPESGQTFEQYLRSEPTLPTEERKAIVVQPLGELPEAHTKIVALTTEYLGHHFGLPTRRAEPYALKTIPSTAKRMKFDSQQILTRWLLQTVLPHRLPGDAAALVAFIGSDLWPGEGWNFVFGEASLTERVGVWSLHRYGDPALNEESFRLVLLRALKLAVHETGHMFSLHHCTAYQCVQSGVNSLEEADVSPLWLCPECLAKICWATKSDPREHLQRTGAFCAQHGLEKEAAFFERSRLALA